MHGVNLIPLKRFPDDRGMVMHMLRKTDPHFQKFGEIYFTTIYHNVIKAWHQHTKMDLNYACVSGMVKIVLYDARKRSKTYGQLEEYYIGDQNYALLQIPHGVINGMRGISQHMAIVANCATMAHLDNEMLRFGLDEVDFDYDWSIKPR